MSDKFMFYDNFWNAIQQLPEDERASACYEFCRYGITGCLPEDKMMRMFCLGVSVSVQKYQGRGGAREGSGAPKGNRNAVKTIKNNQNNQNNHKSQTKTKTKTKTITETEITDWETLFLYWEQNKEGGKYKNNDSRNRMLGKLKSLTNNDLSFAKEVILDAIDHKWQGFCGAEGLYYKKPKPDAFELYTKLANNDSKIPAEVYIDSGSFYLDNTFDEFKDMTDAECDNCAKWLLDKFRCQTLPRDRFVKIVRGFKGAA